MDPIIRRLLENRAESLYEMANVSKLDTKLPYDIWIDSVGKDRKNKHHSPRLKVDVNGDRIPVSIEDTPRILCSKKIPQFGKVSSWIRKYKDVLLQHWNKEITDKEALNKLAD